MALVLFVILVTIIMLGDIIMDLLDQFLWPLMLRRDALHVDKRKRPKRQKWQYR